MDVTATVVVTFNEAIHTPTLTYTITPDPGNWAASWGDEDRVVTLTHDPFAYQTLYTVTVGTAGGLVGNPLSGAPCAWRFTTEEEYTCIYLPLALKDH